MKKNIERAVIYVKMNTAYDAEGLMLSGIGKMHLWYYRLKND